LLGNNWDYRLIFLLFVVPQLGLWGGHTQYQIRWSARLTLAAILFTWWASFLTQQLGLIPLGDEIAVLLDEGVNWLVFIGLFYLLLAALPGWLWLILYQSLERLGITIEVEDELSFSTEGIL